MKPLGFFEAWHARMAARRGRLLLVCLVLLALCSAALLKLRVHDDVRDMLPASAGLRHSLDLMELAPFGRTLFIELRAASDRVDSERLLAAAQTVVGRLPAPRFAPLLPDERSVPRAESLMALLPELADAPTVAALEARVTPAAIRQRMAQNYAALLGMQGVLAKRFIRVDPFGFLAELRDRLESMRFFGGARLRDGFLLKPDGGALLIMLGTTVSVTDAAGSEALLGEVQNALAGLPPGVSATVLSGHRYAVANAGTIKRDLRRVFAVSALGLLLIFGFFFRSRDVLWIALLPAAVLVLAGAVTVCCYDTVSGITLGFGAVLLGITVDFALHVWFALRYSGRRPGRAMGLVARPVLYGCATTMGAFMALAVSDIPGIRQLAVFSLAGLVGGVALALLVFPQLVRPGPPRPAAVRAARPGSWRPALVALTALVLVAGLWAGAGVGLNPQLRSVGMVPADLQRAEDHIRSHWGGARDQAVLFAEGADREQALARNHRLAALLAARLPDSRALSLDRLWPPEAVRRANRQRWQEFVAAHRQTLRTALAEAAAEYRFSARAFAPFERFLQAPPAAASLTAAGLGALESLLSAQQGGRHYIMTLLPDSPGLHALAEAGDLPPGVTLVSQQLLGHRLGRAISRDFILFVAVGCGTLFGLLLLLFRRLGFALLAMVPLLSGIVAVLLMLRLGGGSFNMFHVVALPLVIGLGADYGIFMVCRARATEAYGTARAVLVSGLTTAAGFGALAVARHPALHTLGVTVLVGVGAAILAALLLVPALYRRSA